MQDDIKPINFDPEIQYGNWAYVRHQSDLARLKEMLQADIEQFIPVGHRNLVRWIIVDQDYPRNVGSVGWKYTPRGR